MRQVVDDLGCVLDWAAPGESVILGGHSFGGLASLHFAHAHPERVRALLLIDSGPGFKNPKAQARWQASCEKTSSFIEARGMAEFASRATELTVGRDLELPAARVAQAAIAEQSAHGLAEFGRRIAGPAPPVIDDLQRIAQPALVIVGEKDEAYLRAAEVMAAKLQNAESVTLAGAAHVVNIEAADAFNAAALAFLERVRARGARAG
jgi:pimeloyl-ACP methyl ester carboxylesterase